MVLVVYTGHAWYFHAVFAAVLFFSLISFLEEVLSSKILGNSEKNVAHLYRSTHRKNIYI